jgi:hypothetical protein
MNFFHKKNSISPVKQDFVWLAEYDDGTFFCEFDFLNKKNNNFYHIDRSKIVKFGMIGQNIPMYFSVFGGTFYLDGNMVDFRYVVNKKVYQLTEQKSYYNDIITFKDAFADLHPSKKNNVKSNICQYNFGYKKRLFFDEFEIDLNFICEIPSSNHVRINLCIKSNDFINGELIILKNKSVYHTLKAPLQKNKVCNFIWEVR